MRWHEYFALGRAELTREMLAAIICREYGWDWHTFESQPNWFLNVIVSMLQNEAEESKRRNKQ